MIEKFWFYYQMSSEGGDKRAMMKKFSIRNCSKTADEVNSSFAKWIFVYLTSLVLQKAHVWLANNLIML